LPRTSTHVRVQSANGIDAADATELIAGAETVGESLDCGEGKLGPHSPTAGPSALRDRFSFKGESGKTASRERIDCVVALAMAVDFASRQVERRESVYADRGLAVA
jgi:hypothetical protein